MLGGSGVRVCLYLGQGLRCVDIFGAISLLEIAGEWGCLLRNSFGALKFASGWLFT